MATVESSAFFLRNNDTGNEIIIFGDVEPDTISMDPRNHRVWETAAPKIAAGTLRAIFIECSYNDSVDDAYLYGHLCPRHLVTELTFLADKVMGARENNLTDRKRKLGTTTFNELGTDSGPSSKRNLSVSGAKPRSLTTSRGIGPRSQPIYADLPTEPLDGIADYGNTDDGCAPDTARWTNADPLPLAGLSVYIIHIKESLTDGPPPGERIIQELREHSEAARLGCEFFLPNPAEGIWI